MNKEWSELNKIMQASIRKKDTYDHGISTMFELTFELFASFGNFKKSAV